MKNQSNIKKIPKKLLLVALIFLLLPCFAFGASTSLTTSKVKTTAKPIKDAKVKKIPLQKKEQPQCCVNGKLYPYPKTQCRAKKGRYYRSPEEAAKQCLRGLLKPQKPVRLPDLDVISTSVDTKCFMKVTVRNIGGPINAADHIAAKIHLSSGAGLVSRKTKLIDIDPGGALRAPGGSITYTTKMIITEPNQATLIRLDTEHVITEANETNNDDDAKLTCKTPLVWCCVKGKLGRTSKEMCRQAGGSPHKNEQKAKEVCGEKHQLPSPTHQTSGVKKEKSAIIPAAEMRGISPEASQVNTPEVVPLLGPRRIIEIESPSRYQTYHPGDTVTIRYRFTRIVDVVAGDITFKAVYQRGGDEIETTTVGYDPLVDGLNFRDTVITLPDDAPEGLYSIIAEQSGSEDSGEGNPFWVYRESTGAAITLEQPYPGQRFFPGSVIELKYYFSRPVEFGMMTFDLYTMESATPISKATLNYE
ncbi:MAG: hypothetical protein K8R67_03040, partial [Desulfobacteraceae bacterium]|nr:hypothetical protein [Desulfobacteraceae bacterium]